MIISQTHPNEFVKIQLVQKAVLLPPHLCQHEGNRAKSILIHKKWEEELMERNQREEIAHFITFVNKSSKGQYVKDNGISDIYVEQNFQRQGGSLKGGNSLNALKMYIQLLIG
jgi:hypothetical protein